MLSYEKWSLLYKLMYLLKCDRICLKIYQDSITGPECSKRDKMKAGQLNVISTDLDSIQPSTDNFVANTFIFEIITYPRSSDILVISCQEVVTSK